MIENIRYYFWASFRRKNIDQCQKKYESLYQGVVIDIGGRDRGKFKKPKEEVEKWLFADIQEKYKPDLVMSITDMSKIADSSVDVISAIELFEYVDKTDQALSECYRILKKDGNLIISAPFMNPIADDPFDLQRWTKNQWINNLRTAGFRIEKFEIMGLFFTTLGDMLKTLIKSMPIMIRYFLYLAFPLLDLIVLLDKTALVKNNRHLKKFQEGYFMIAKK